MKIVNEYPPNYLDIINVLPVRQGVCFAYGDTLYVPEKEFVGQVDDILMAHEETHMRQQEELGPEKWWKYYLEYDGFRTAQEVEAYQNQYRFASKKMKDRNKLDLLLRRLAKDLSSPLYAGVLTFSEARKAIKSTMPLHFDMSNFK